jgi:hypothetical protein
MTTFLDEAKVELVVFDVRRILRQSFLPCQGGFRPSVGSA